MLPLAAPADEAQLLAACAQLWQRRLDRSRPLWEMWFLPGLPDGRVGLFMRLHHSIADGVAGIAAALDELIEAASALGERPPSAPSGTRRRC